MPDGKVEKREESVPEGRGSMTEETEGMRGQSENLHGKGPEFVIQ